MRSLRRRHPNLAITFKTIHASKGLEADNFVLLGADNAHMGFPSMIVDDPLLALVSPEAEPFANVEEHRVMYVAMTRARRTLTILASEASPSAFVTELLKDPAYDEGSPRETRERTHTCGQCEGRLLFMAGGDCLGWYRCDQIKHSSFICSGPSPTFGRCSRGQDLNRLSLGERLTITPLPSAAGIPRSGARQPRFSAPASGHCTIPRSRPSSGRHRAAVASPAAAARHCSPV